MAAPSPQNSPLFERERALGAVWTYRDGVAVPGDYGNVRAEYAALQHGAGLVDLAFFGVLQVQGRDRTAWLHKITTANFQGLGPGRAGAGLLLNATGHVVADFTALVQPEWELLYASRNAKDRLLLHLHRAIFREKVNLEDVSAAWTLISLQGLQARSVLEHTEHSLPSLEPLQFGEGGGCLIIRNPRAGADGYDLLVPSDQVGVQWDRLLAQGARPAGLEALNIARVEAGIPWYGDDYDESMLAPEARLEPLIAENKGCYTGQEVIARIKNRGHVNRLLVRFQAQGREQPSRGARIWVQDREVGWVTSPVYSLAREAPLAFGYIRRENSEPGTHVQIELGGDRVDAVIV